MDLSALASAIGQIFTPWTFFMLFTGTSLGIIVGAIPGMTGAMLIALTLPITFYMDPFNAIVLLISMYVGAISGGLITATLLRMPGTPAAVMTPPLDCLRPFQPLPTITIVALLEVSTPEPLMDTRT